MKLVTALLPLAAVFYQALAWATLVAYGKTSFALSSAALYAIGLLLTIAWAVVVLRHKPQNP